MHQMTALRDFIRDGRAKSDIANERPISFSEPMIHALLAGAKTQTRRVISPAPAQVTRQHGQRVFFDASGRAIRCRYGVAGDLLWVRERFTKTATGKIVYAANGARAARWSPSYHMPRIASRIHLRVISVRAKSLSSIDESDARAEGYAAADTNLPPLKWFRALWDSINDVPGKRWGDRPWVWAIEFEVITPALRRRRARL